MELTEERYKKIADFFLKKPIRLRMLRFVYHIFPLVIAAAYIILLVALAFAAGLPELLKALMIPAAAFLAVTVFRRVLNLERPYEKLSITPLMERNKSGQSFPSRHCASAFVISTVILNYNAVIGALLLVVSLCIAVSRILAGVHFTRDAAVGSLIGLLFGLVIFLL